MSKWEEKRLEDIIDVNPPVKLKRENLTLLLILIKYHLLAVQ